MMSGRPLFTAKPCKLSCIGKMDAQWVAGFLDEFKQRQINLRSIALSAAWHDEESSRLHIEFELPVSETEFMNHLKSRLANDRVLLSSLSGP